MLIPIFKSNYSCGRSILTLDKFEAPDKKKDKKESVESAENRADSIINIALENNLKNVLVFDDNFSGALEGYTNCREAGLKFTFGVRLTCVPDMTKKDEESFDSEHKIVVVAKNRQGYEALVKVYTKAATDGFYYEPRIDVAALKTLWQPGLELVIPFYDSYIFKNLLTMSTIIPNFNGLDPYYIIEHHGLPFDSIVEKHIEVLTSKILRSHSIYYKKREDFLAYLTLRCINKRSTLEKPNLDHMHSDSFSVEGWKDENLKYVTN